MENPLQVLDPRSDLPTTRKLVRSFISFLNSVEYSSDADSESLEVVKDCLSTVFKLDSFSDGPVPPTLLWDIFNTWEIHEKLRPGQYPIPYNQKGKASSSSSSNRTISQDPQLSEKLSRDELFGRMYTALDKIDYFKVSNSGEEDSNQISKASEIFDEAYAEIKSSKEKKLCVAELAEFFKTKGNKAMQSKQYDEAIELYNCAVAMCEKNAVYYCNRAAAYTLIDKTDEAIQDCLKSIEIDPNYSKAYSRIGSAYFAQQNYQDALFKGYYKALELDPSNKNVQQNIKVTKSKFAEQARGQSPRSANPPDVDPNEEGQNGPTEAEFTFGENNMRVNFRDENEDVRVTGALRSVMDAFSQQMGPDFNISFETGSEESQANGPPN